MKKRYLKTIEDIEALRNTDTKIYCESHGGYYKFINGVLCYFQSNGEDFQYQGGLWVSQEPYIEVEDDPLENNIGKLGWFYDYTEKASVLDFLEKISDTEVCRYVTKSTNVRYNHFRPLTPEEVEKYTGYKVCSGHQCP